MDGTFWPHGDPDRVARVVLAEPLFARPPVSTNVAARPSFWALIWDWLYQHILRPLLTPLARAFHATHGIGTGAGIVLVIVALLVLGFVVVRIALAFMRTATPVARDPSVPPADALRSAAQWRQVARDSAARGDFARAIAALWAVALALLDERGLVTFDAARTPDEYGRLVRRSPSGTRASEPFERLSQRFVYATYAAAFPVRGDFETAERALRELEPAL